MGVVRRVQYLFYCDIDGCKTSQTASQSTEFRAIAMKEAIGCGWEILPGGRWICPLCVASGIAAARSGGEA